KINEQHMLRVYGNPGNTLISSDKLSYSSQNSQIVNVDNNGKITGKGVGSTIITVIYTENGKVLQNSITINVSTSAVTTQISITADTYSFAVNNEITITVTAQPNSRVLSASEVNCVATDSTILDVKGSFVIGGKNAGTTTLTCTYIDSGLQFSDSKSFTVYEQSLSIETDSDSIQVGSTVTIRVYSEPNHVIIPNTELTITSSKEEVLTASNEGVLTAKTSGTSEITVTYNSLTAKKQFTVFEDQTPRITVVVPTTTIYVYQSVSFDVFLEPGHTKLEPSEDLLFGCSNCVAIEINDKNLTVFGLDVGTSEMNVHYIQGTTRLDAKVVFTVILGTIHPTKISVSFNNATVAQGNPFSFSVLISPPKTTERGVEVSVSPEDFYVSKNVALYAENTFTVTPQKIGTYTITAKSTDVPTLIATFTLYVEETNTRGYGLLATGVTPEGGWYDCNKQWAPQDNITIQGVTYDYMPNDSPMCWAATSANIIDWYQNSINLTNVPEHCPNGFNKWSNGTEKANDNTAYSQSEVYEYFRVCSTNQGYYIQAGLNWFFTGASQLQYPQNYEKGFRYQEYEGFDKKQRVADDINFYSDRGRDYYVREFKNAVVGGFKNGSPMGISVYYKNGGGHALTLWGYELGDADV
ncbi:bacterial Ig family (group 2) protein, partial [Entamoeba invadens IP1]